MACVKSGALVTIPIDSLDSERNDARAELQRRWPNQPCRQRQHLQLPDYSRVREMADGAWLLSDREGRESMWSPTGLGKGDEQWWVKRDDE